VENHRLQLRMGFQNAYICSIATKVTASRFNILSKSINQSINQAFVHHEHLEKEHLLIHPYEEK